MRVLLKRYQAGQWQTHPIGAQSSEQPVQLALCFGQKALLQNEALYQSVAGQFPHAAIVSCSTAGEIYQDEVNDDSLVLVGLSFAKTTIVTASVNIRNFGNSHEAATALATQLPLAALAHVLVFSDGHLVNGSELVKGLGLGTGKKAMITGGLAGDGAQFTATLVGLNAQPEEGLIVAVGFYGDAIAITHDSQGGWDVFGMEKRVTRSANNVLFEIDQQSALGLYKKYLGPKAAELPAAALLFPLSVWVPGATQPVVRTILSINEAEQSMTFAGDVPIGSKVRFMKADFNKLVEAAGTAAENAMKGHPQQPVFSLLISCVGRKLILEERTVAEVQAINSLYKGLTVVAGFYSYGEISPSCGSRGYQLHNQTMTITSFSEW